MTKKAPGWRDIPIGGDILEAGSSAKQFTGSWRTSSTLTNAGAPWASAAVASPSTSASAATAPMSSIQGLRFALTLKAHACKSKKNRPDATDTGRERPIIQPNQKFICNQLRTPPGASQENVFPNRSLFSSSSRWWMAMLDMMRSIELRG